MNWASLTGPAFEDAKSKIAILPIGSVERHGDHLPLGTDGFLPAHIADEVEDELDAIIMPTLWYGSCNAMRDFPGTIDIDSMALTNYLASLMREINRNGIKILVVINGHGGNTTPINMAARMIAAETPLSIIVLDWWKDLGSEKLSLFSSPGHAGEDETSAMLAVCKGGVDMQRALSNDVKYPPFKIHSRILDSKIYGRAITGDATKATKEKGEALLRAAKADLVNVIKIAKAELGI